MIFLISRMLPMSYDGKWNELSNILTSAHALTSTTTLRSSKSENQSPSQNIRFSGQSACRIMKKVTLTWKDCPELHPDGESSIPITRQNRPTSFSEFSWKYYQLPNVKLCIRTLRKLPTPWCARPALTLTTLASWETLPTPVTAIVVAPSLFGSRAGRFWRESSVGAEVAESRNGLESMPRSEEFLTGSDKRHKIRASVHQI